MGFKRDMSSADSFAEKKAKVVVFNIFKNAKQYIILKGTVLQRKAERG